MMLAYKKAPYSEFSKLGFRSKKISHAIFSPQEDHHHTIPYIDRTHTYSIEAQAAYKTFYIACPHIKEQTRKS